MTDRDTQIAVFLQRSGRGDWQRAPLAGDASMRRYERLTSPNGRKLVLMDAPPDTGEDIRPFVRIAALLRNQGISAPAIHSEDAQNGFLLTEDLGDDRFYEVIKEDPNQERPLYEAAVDLLVALHRGPVPNLTPLTPRALSQLSGLVIERYRGGILGATDPALQHRFEAEFDAILRQTLRGDMVIVHRDFHAQNLMWLPDRDGIARVGVIDFQDAHIGHPAYDLVSLLQDARRDVSAAIEMQMIDRYIAATDLDASGFRAAYAMIGLQRNLRILGVFARLSLDHGKAQYIDLIPRVWGHVTRALEHPAVAPLADWLVEELPAPTPENLAKLRP